MRDFQSNSIGCFDSDFFSNKNLTDSLLTSPPRRVERPQDLLFQWLEKSPVKRAARLLDQEKRKGETKMIPYGFGFGPGNYPPADLQIDFKALGRNCKALVKKVGRRARHKTDK